METEELDDVKVNDIYVYWNTGNLYKVIYLSKMKHPDTNKWINCVIYKSFENDKVFVRDIDNFRNNFKLAM